MVRFSDVPRKLEHTSYNIEEKHQISALLDLCEGNPPVIGGFPSQRASNGESVFTLWLLHDGSLHTYPSSLWLDHIWEFAYIPPTPCGLQGHAVRQDIEIYLPLDSSPASLSCLFCGVHLTQWGWEQMVAILQTTFMKSSSGTNIVIFLFKFLNLLTHICVSQPGWYI